MGTGVTGRQPALHGDFLRREVDNATRPAAGQIFLPFSQFPPE